MRIACSPLVVLFADLRVDQAHGAQGVGAKGHTGAYCGEGMRRLVGVEGDVVTEETYGEGETGYTAAADGYCEGFWRWGVLRSEVGHGG